MPHDNLALTWTDLAAQRAFLVRYARQRLMDPTLAEDLVHDVFEAVMNGRAPFEGRSALRSWLVGILRHKIVDLVRQRSGHDSLDVDDPDDACHLECTAPRPDEMAELRQRLARTLDRLGELPTALRDAMQLRVLAEQSTDTVCRALGITEANLFVRLHRARTQLAAA
jgi:RNA polymerase sigma-70 factor (ECF subfamily)